MTNEQLCRLALAAIDSEDGWLVVKDAIEEMGWSTSYEVCGHAAIAISAMSGHPLSVAAVLFFADWYNTSKPRNKQAAKPWTVAERCVVRVPIPNMSLEMLSGLGLESLARDTFGLTRVSGERDDDLRARCMSSPVYSPLAIYGPSMRNQR